MKLVKDINKLIIKKIIEIIFVVFFIFVSISLWESENAKNFLTTVNTFSVLNYTNIEVKNPVNSGLYPMRDEEALNQLNPYLIKVINETYTAESYTLVLKILKESSLDYRFLKISIDNNIYNLTDFEIQEDSEYFVFLLDVNSISGTVKNYNVKIWLSEMVGNDSQNRTLFIDFDLINQEKI